MKIRRDIAEAQARSRGARWSPSRLQRCSRGLQHALAISLRNVVANLPWKPIFVGDERIDTGECLIVRVRHPVFKHCLHARRVLIATAPVAHPRAIAHQRNEQQMIVGTQRAGALDEIERLVQPIQREAQTRAKGKRLDPIRPQCQRALCRIQCIAEAAASFQHLGQIELKIRM